MEMEMDMDVDVMSRHSKLLIQETQHFAPRHDMNS